jgi:hypothetical protein
VPFLLLFFIPSTVVAALLAAPAWFFGRQRVRWHWTDYGQLLLLTPCGFLLLGLASLFDKQVLIGAITFDPINVASDLYGFVLYTVIVQPWTRLGFAWMGREGRAATGVRWLLNLALAAAFCLVVPMHAIIADMFSGM